MSRLTRDGTAEPVWRDQILRHARRQGNMIFPVQLTTSRIGNLTRLIHTLLYVMTIHTYIHTWIQYFALAIIISDSGQRMHRDKIPPQRIHAACCIVTQGSCCAERFAEFNGNCESYCSLEQLVASLSAADEGKSAAGAYHPKTEGYYIRKHLYEPPGLLFCRGCTWTRKVGSLL